MRIYDVGNKLTIVKPNKENNYNGYYEIPYKEYDTDGKFIGSCTEDFSGERLRKLKLYEILIPSGLVNKGGKRIWQSMTFCWTFGKPRDIKRIYFHKYYKEVQVRKID